MMSVFKYLVPNEAYPKILLPVGAQVLSFQSQSGSLFIWALVDTTKPSEKRMFITKLTGEDFDGHGKYIGTAQLSGGSFVVHLFEAT